MVSYYIRMLAWYERLKAEAIESGDTSEVPRYDAEIKTYTEEVARRDVKQ